LIARKSLREPWPGDHLFDRAAYDQIVKTQDIAEATCLPACLVGEFR
jgi:hypothetical protein